MARILTVSVAPPPDVTKVIVDFYDDENRDLLLRSPASSILSKIKIPATMEIPTVDILTYFLFHKKSPGSTGYRNYRTIRTRYLNALVDLDDLVEFADGSMRVARSDGILSPALIEAPWTCDRRSDCDLRNYALM